MKRLVMFFVLAAAAIAQSATRPVTLPFTASPSTSVTSYKIFACTVAPPATTCTPDTTGTPVATPTTAGTIAVMMAIGSSYVFSLVAVAPPCTSTTPLTTPCGNSAAALWSPNPLPVPPMVAGGATQGAGVP